MGGRRELLASLNLWFEPTCSVDKPSKRPFNGDYEIILRVMKGGILE